jgi:6-phosphogluconate dehydrogenase (decarboxylating)
VRVGVIGRADRLVPRLRAAGLEPVVHAAAADRNAAADGVETVGDYRAFLESLDHPRVFLLDLEPGPGVDAVIDEGYAFMEPGDVVVDLTGSYWCDTLRRYRRMRHRSLYYVDAALIEGTGPSALLAAGDPRGVEIAAGPLGLLAVPGALVRAGGAGAAHYALMLHDAFRIALLQAASEVRQAVEAYPNGPTPELSQAITGAAAEGHGPRAPWLLDDAVRLECATRCSPRRRCWSSRPRWRSSARSRRRRAWEGSRIRMRCCEAGPR